MSQLSRYLNDANSQNLTHRKIVSLAEKKGHKISTASVSRYLAGAHTVPPSRSVLEALAAALGIDLNLLLDVAGLPPAGDPFHLPSEADTLTQKEREVILDMVSVLVDAKRTDTSDTPYAYATADLPAPNGYSDSGHPLTPDGEEFRPDLYENHQHIMDTYGKAWYQHYYELAAKRQATGDDIEETYE